MHRRVAFSFVTALALVLATASAALTAPGDLDPTFGGDGIVPDGSHARRGRRLRGNDPA